MTLHSEAAQALITEIRALREKIPNFIVSTDKDARRKLAPAASVPADFVERMAVAAETNAALAGKEKIDPVQARDLMAYAEAFGPLADEVEALVNFIRHSVTAARNKAGSDALTTYAIARRLARRPEHADLVPHVTDMRRTLGARARKPKAKAEQPAPPQAPTTPAPSSATPAPPTTTTPKP